MKHKNDRGFALLVVLWSLVLISLLTAQVLSAGRTAVTLAANLSTAAQGRAYADGAINEAVFHLLAPGAAHWLPDGSVHVLMDGSERLTVRVRVLDDKINPNLASAALLAGLFQASGATSAQAVQLADAIIQWRSQAVSKQAMQQALATYQRAGLRFGPPARKFADLGELSSIIGMPPALLAAALPHMSLYQSCAPDPAHADLVVRQALALSGEPGGHYAPTDSSLPSISIEAELQGPGLGIYRNAVVSINGLQASPAFQLLALSDAH